MTVAVLAMFGLSLASPLQRPQVGTLRVGAESPKIVVSALDGKTTIETGGKRERPLVLIFGSCT